MNICLPIPDFLSSQLFVEYVSKPLAAAVWVLVVGAITLTINNIRRKRDVKKVCTKLYVTHREVIAQLQQNVSSLDKEFYTLMFPEVDKGGNLVKSINAVPKWTPFSSFSYNTYYLVGALNDYNELRTTILKSHLEGGATKQQCKQALNLACNSYLKMLSISDPYTYKENKTESKIKDDIKYSLKYFGVD